MKTRLLIIALFGTLLGAHGQVLTSGYYDGSSSSNRHYRPVQMQLAGYGNNSLGASGFSVRQVDPITGFQLTDWFDGSGTNHSRGRVFIKFSGRGHFRGHVTEGGSQIVGRIFLPTHPGSHRSFVRKVTFHHVDSDGIFLTTGNTTDESGHIIPIFSIPDPDPHPPIDTSGGEVIIRIGDNRWLFQRRDAVIPGGQ